MKNKGLHTIKNTGFKTPQNYFEAFEINIQTTARLKKEVPQSGFKTPDHYFETFKVISPTLKKETKVLPLYKKVILSFGSIAAALLVFFSLNLFKKDLNFNALSTATLDSYLLEEANSSELSHLFSNSELTESQFIDYDLNIDTIDSLLDNEDFDELILD
ncbi:hypothetical protein ES677_00455 [Bizionia gelidisalsuginis]|uniref:Uncharacterized protein n=2 Tax=Bizionia TaxID=283785 RepID=A0A8H2LNX9_9FLAO|nr:MULTISPECIES: hypothetical protein [Bizionia]TYB77437.1 hypothetical protein ES676_03855 [Bizionia saleffrena]TYC17882.1 hypothetical protein ES677_00455 [Bizionia gelidisalsuginis]